MRDKRADDRRRPTTPRDSRRPYSTPRLIEYGSVAKLTRGTKSVNSDFPQAGFKKTGCL